MISWFAKTKVNLQPFFQHTMRGYVSTLHFLYFNGFTVEFSSNIEVVHFPIAIMLPSAASSRKVQKIERSVF